MVVYINKNTCKTYKILIFTILTIVAIFCNPTKAFAKTTITKSNITVHGLGTRNYTGNAIEPNIKVAVNNKPLIKGKDYTIYCYSNINVGTGHIDIKGTGNYKGIVTKDFTIKAVDILKCDVHVQASCTYSGEARTPTVTVKFNNRYLTEGTDYTLQYFNNTDVGTARVIVYGQRNFIGTVTKYFEIKQASLANAGVTISPKTSTYTGKACTPKVTIKVNGKLLTKNKDYGITYLNNTNPGTGIVQITGKGNYFGTINKTFAIKKVEIRNTKISITPSKVTYTGKYFKPKITITYNGNTLKNGTDYIVTYSNNLRAGRGNIRINGRGNYCGTYIQKFTISPRMINNNDVTISYAETVYTGKSLAPLVTVKCNDKTLSRGRDYTVTYSNNINVGTAKVIVKGRGNYAGEVIKTFKITQRSINTGSITKTVKSATYTGSPIEASVYLKYNGRTLRKGIDYTLKYEQNTNVTGKAKVTITGIGNFEGSYTATFNINPKNIRNTTISYERQYVYTGTEIIPTINVKDGDRGLIQGKDYTVIFGDNINIGTGRFTVKGINNYTGSVTLSFRIVRKSISDDDVVMTYNNMLMGNEIDFNKELDQKKLQINIKYKGKSLVQGTDYEVRIPGDKINYIDNEFTIYGRGNFIGKITGTVLIKPIDQKQIAKVLEEIINHKPKYNYKNGGSSPKTGFSCSGLVKYVYNTYYGYNLDGNVVTQWTSEGKLVSRRL